MEEWVSDVQKDRDGVKEKGLRQKGEDTSLPRDNGTNDSYTATHKSTYIFIPNEDRDRPEIEGKKL